MAEIDCSRLHLAWNRRISGEICYGSVVAGGGVEAGRWEGEGRSGWEGSEGRSGQKMRNVVRRSLRDLRMIFEVIAALCV